jgi:hypothetical protein
MPRACGKVKFFMCGIMIPQYCHSVADAKRTTTESRLNSTFATYLDSGVATRAGMTGRDCGNDGTVCRGL